MANITQDALLTYLNTLLNSDAFEDYAPNGLQVEGKTCIARLVTGVTACKALLDKALSLKADAVLVHHGYFWRGESPCITGIKKNRLQVLLTNDINLLAYHLPLDAHPIYGNNVQLAQLLNIDITDTRKDGLIYVGQLPHPQTLADFALSIEQRLHRKPLCIQAGHNKIQKVAWCTGAGQDFIEDVAALNVDAFISGEVSERTFHDAKEYGVSYIAAGHHATERAGVKALGEHLADKFGIDCVFVDIENPI